VRRAREHHIQVHRTARYWTLGDPGTARDIWFVLHGYKQLARRFLRRFEPIDHPRRLVVAAEGLSRFYVSPGTGRHGSESVVGASWMTREDRTREIDDYVAYLDLLAGRILEECSPSPERLTVLGFSQGVATACRWVMHGAIDPDRVICWGDFTPPDLDLELSGQRLDRVELILARGSRDPALSAELARDEAERLARAGVTYRTVRYEGGHEIDEATLRSLARGS